MKRATATPTPLSSDPPSRFAISVLGPMRATLDGRDIKLHRRKARALLAYLALTDGQQETRERLVGLLWSESEEDKARSSLRGILHEMGEILQEAGFAGLARDRLRIAIEQAQPEVDAHVILEMTRAVKIHPRLIEEALISESFLRDLDDVDPAFGVWAKARRQGFHDHLLNALEAILRAESAGRGTRRECAQAILNLDPTHEEACRVFMRLSAEIGDSAAAQRAYKTLWEVLENEYDTEPSSETIALIAEIKQGLITPAAAPAEVSELAQPPPAPADAMDAGIDPEARLALLVEPFGMMGIETDSLYLVDGFRHDLIATLTRFREWFLVSAPNLSAKQIKDSRVTGIYCVAATAYRTGDAVSLVLTLREHESGIHVWSDKFVVGLSNWFESQQKIVRQIAISLNIQVSLGRLGRISNETVVSLAVHDLWLRGQAALNRFSAENWKTADRMFTAATQRAPDFAPGYSSLAQMANVEHFVHPGLPRTAANEQKALAFANKAVALDPMDSRSQLALGWSLAMAKNYRHSALRMDLARQLNPSDSWTLISSALCLAFCGNLEMAADLAGQSLTLTLAPSRLHWAYQVHIAFLRGAYAEAVEAADRAQDAVLSAVAWSAAALIQLGDEPAAREAAARFMNLVRSNWFGSDPPTDDVIGRWLLLMYPIAEASDWERLRTSITAAGIPDGGARHHGW